MSSKVQVLASVMNQKNQSILKKMNINTDAIIINQIDKTNEKWIIKIEFSMKIA